MLHGPDAASSRATSEQFIDDVEMALYACKIISYAQGFVLMRGAAKEYELGRSTTAASP